LVESASEQALNRFEASDEQRRREAGPPAPPSSLPGALGYRLSTDVPEYWVPLLPVRVGNGLRLRRGAVLETDGSQAVVHAAGRLLAPVPGQPLELYEEEVPREGIRVTRSYQYTRWTDGSTHLWMGVANGSAEERDRAGCGLTAWRRGRDGSWRGTRTPTLLFTRCVPAVWRGVTSWVLAGQVGC
jgi:hypothetical protein